MDMIAYIPTGYYKLHLNRTVQQDGWGYKSVTYQLPSLPLTL